MFHGKQSHRGNPHPQPAGYCVNAARSKILEIILTDNVTCLVAKNHKQPWHEEAQGEPDVRDSTPYKKRHSLFPCLILLLGAANVSYETFLKWPHKPMNGESHNDNE